MISRLRPVHLLPALLLYAIAAGAMFVWPGLPGRVADACGGVTALDVRPFWTAADARALITACGADGRAAYRDLALLDLVYPAIAGAAMLALTAVLLRPWADRRLAQLLLAPAVVMTVFDYAENAVVWRLLNTWPDVDPTLAAIGGPATTIKFVAGFVTYCAPIAVGVARLARLLPSRGATTRRT